MLYYSKFSDTNRIEKTVGIGFLLSLILPQFNLFFYLITPLLCIFFKIHIIGKTRPFVVKYLVLFSFFITFLMNIPNAPSSKAIMSFANIFLIFAVFPNIGDVKIRNIYLYLALVYILFSQIVYMLHIPLLTNTFNNWYPTDNENFLSLKDKVTFDNYSTFRLGGIYRNPNDCSRIINLLMAIYFVENKNIKLLKTTPFVLLSLFAIFLTGSRTGLAVGLLLLFFGLIFYKHRGSKIGILVIFALASILLFSVLGALGSRITAFDKTGSVDMKFATFLNYLSQDNSSVELLIGNLDPGQFIVLTYNELVMNYFDADYGYLVFCYGLMGALCVVVFYVSLYRKMNKNNRFVLLLFVWAISNSVIFSFRMFFPMMLVFSRCYCQSVNNLTTYNTIIRK